MEFRRPLRMGETVRRESEIVSIEPKQGRSGTLVFLTARHTIYGSGEVAAIDEHDIVFREAARPGEAPAAGKPAPESAAWRRSLRADPVLLFRFSALTFNGHRIHYDQPYVTGEEGYPGLIFHGPLQATLLLGLATERRNGDIPHQFAFRSVRPLFSGGRISLNAASGEGETVLWIADQANNVTMKASC